MADGLPDWELRRGDEDELRLWWPTDELFTTGDVPVASNALTDVNAAEGLNQIICQINYLMDDDNYVEYIDPSDSELSFVASKAVEIADAANVVRGIYSEDPYVFTNYPFNEFPLSHVDIKELRESIDLEKFTGIFAIFRVIKSGTAAEYYYVVYNILTGEWMPGDVGTYAMSHAEAEKYLDLDSVYYASEDGVIVNPTGSTVYVSDVYYFKDEYPTDCSGSSIKAGASWSCSWHSWYEMTYGVTGHVSQSFCSGCYTLSTPTGATALTGPYAWVTHSGSWTNYEYVSSGDKLADMSYSNTHTSHFPFGTNHSHVGMDSHTNYYYPNNANNISGVYTGPWTQQTGLCGGAYIWSLRKFYAVGSIAGVLHLNCILWGGVQESYSTTSQIADAELALVTNYGSGDGQNPDSGAPDIVSDASAAFQDLWDVAKGTYMYLEDFFLTYGVPAED